MSARVPLDPINVHHHSNNKHLKNIYRVAQLSGLVTGGLVVSISVNIRFNIVLKLHRNRPRLSTARPPLQHYVRTSDLSPSFPPDSLSDARQASLLVSGHGARRSAQLSRWCIDAARFFPAAVGVCSALAKRAPRRPASGLSLAQHCDRRALRKDSSSRAASLKASRFVCGEVPARRVFVCVARTFGKSPPRKVSTCRCEKCCSPFRCVVLRAEVLRSPGPAGRGVVCVCVWWGSFCSCHTFAVAVLPLSFPCRCGGSLRRATAPCRCAVPLRRATRYPATGSGVARDA